MEIERKYLVETPPKNYAACPCRRIEQGYLCTDPVVRVRQDDCDYYLTYKGKGLLSREEYNLPLTGEAYAHLIAKADGLVLTKLRYEIPYETRDAQGNPRQYTIEMDIFFLSYEGLILAEVEFETEADAFAFVPPSWFGRDVTFTGEFQNSRLSRPKNPAEDGET